MVPSTIFFPSFVFVAIVVFTDTCSMPSSFTKGIITVESIESQRVDSDGENCSLLHEPDKMSCSKTVVFK